jgi:hypothetical protein
MSWWSKIVDAVTGTERKEVRTRNKKGQYVGDDESTPDVDESRTTVRVKKSTLTLPGNTKKPKKSGRKNHKKPWRK